MSNYAWLFHIEGLITNMDASHKRHLPAAGFAFLLWGGWAWLANQAASGSRAIFAGVLQGSASAVITLIMAAIATRLFLRIQSRPLAVLLPPCLIVSVSSSVLYLIHSLGQTPNLWLTIIPPSGLAFAFCLYLTLRLASQSRTSHADEPRP